MAKRKLKENSGQPAETAAPELPPGVTLVRTLRGHTDFIGRIAWSPDGLLLASPSEDKTIRLWNPETGECLRLLGGHDGSVNSVSFYVAGRTLASGGDDSTVKLWDAASGRLVRTLTEHSGAVVSVAFDRASGILASGGNDKGVKLRSLFYGREQWDAASAHLLRTLGGHEREVNSIAFDPKGHHLASGSDDSTIKLWDTATGDMLQTLEGHRDMVFSVVFDATGRILASASNDTTVRLWDVVRGRLLRTLEGHTSSVTAVDFTPDGRLLASRSRDHTIRLWNCVTGACISVINEPTLGYWHVGLAFHPQHSLLATVGSDPGTSERDRDRVIHIWQLDVGALLAQAPVIQASHYVNAKVVLLGDTGVGKSGLSLVLNGKPFEATDSTPGRKVWTFQSQEVELHNSLKQTRETLLWDLAGQPGYRVIHQLHLNEVAVALVVFDARSETDPLAGVRHWERALRLAQQRQGASCVPMKKFLVSARTDRGTVSVSKERLESLLEEFGFDRYFETSAKEGWQIKELREAIEQGIPWEFLPEVSSSVLFADIKAFLLEAKQSGRLVAQASHLYDDFAAAHPDVVASEPNLRDQFDTCIGRLENRDLIRRLSFGGYVLLQPELLDAYASAMVNAAKEEPDGLGSIAEDAALAGQFFVPKGRLP